MNRMILFFALIWGGYAFASNFQIVSDFDDTVKITNVHSKKEGFCRTLLSDEVFTGIPELYRRFHALGAPISFVSGGFIQWKWLMHDDFRNNRIPQDQIFMRGFFADSTLDFKYSQLVKIMRRDAQPMVLIGDDTQFDPDAYAQFRNMYPQQVLATYIRQVTGRPLPLRMRRFFTPYEIAVYEYLDGRLTFADVEFIGNEILAATKADGLFPAFTKCPQTESDLIGLIDISYGEPRLSRLTYKVAEHLVRLCNSRQ